MSDIEFDLLDTVPEPPEPEPEPLPERIAARFNIQSALDALKPREPVKEFIAGLQRRQSIGMTYSGPGQGKTHYVIHQGICIASGRHWLQFDVNQGNVLYINEDMPELYFTEIIERTMKGMNIDYDIPFYHSSYPGINLEKPADQAELEMAIRFYRADVVYLDTLSNLMTGDENSKQDTQPVFNALKLIAKRADTSFHIVHHANKQGGYRGSSAIQGSIDVMVKVESEENGLVNFTTEKTRYSKPLKWAAMAKWSDDKFTLNMAEYEKKPAYSKAENYVLNYLDANGESEVTQIMAAADVCSPEGARRAVYFLADKGTIRRTNPGEGKAKYAAL